MSASEGHHITLYDSLYAKASNGAMAVSFNGDYEDKDGLPQVATGDIVFSGKYTEEDLKALKADYTQQELTDSLTSEVYDMTHLYGGRLRIEDGAIYKGNGITAEVDSAATVRLQGGTLSHSGYKLTFNAGTMLEAQGVNSITASSLDLLDGSALTFTLGEANLTTAAVTLTGTFNQGGALTINLADDGTVALGSKYALLTMSSSATPTTWDASKVTVEGLDADISDLSWSNGTLYLTAPLPELTTATWSGAASMVWNTTAKNWTQDGIAYAYKDGVDVIFGDTGAGTVTLSGTLAPKSVLVNSSKKYTLSGSGKLTGDMTLTKSGTGSLTISTANTYTGGTILNAGTLVAGNSSAFGTGNILLNGGKLMLGGFSISNAASVEDANMVIENGTQIGDFRVANSNLQANAFRIASNNIVIENSGTVSFRDVISSSPGGGGAMYSRGSIALRHNNEISFIGNQASHNGGACHIIAGDSFLIEDNDEVVFRNNHADYTDSNYSFGGAISMTISAPGTCVLDIRNNGNITFSGNYTKSRLTSYGDPSQAGAVYIDGSGYEHLNISGNDLVEFRGNYATVPSYFCQLGGLFTSNVNVNFSAGEGQVIAFFDTIHLRKSDGVSIAVSFNTNFENKTGGEERALGDIIFSGKFAKEDLSAYNPKYTQNDLIASLTSHVNAWTHLYGGRLRVEDGAVYSGYGITAEVDSDATVRLQGGALSLGGYKLTFNAGTTLEAQGVNSIGASSLDLLDGSALTFTLGEANLTTAAVTLTGTFNQGGALTINLADDGTMALGNEYALLKISGSTATPTTWDPTKVTVNGLDADISDLSWSNGTLYLTAPLPELTTATWTGAESMVWDTTAKNWTQDGYKFAYKDGVDVIFGDTGAGTVTLAGTLAPKSVLVDSSSDYTWSGSGKLTGDMTLTKSGTGSLTISTANNFTGGTAINGGKVVAAHATALGTGVVTLSNGTLEIAANGFANGVSSSGASALQVQDGYTLALSQMLANSGILTVSGTVNASALTLNTTAATRIDVNGQSGASGFAKSAYYSVQVVNGGTVGGDDAVITHINLPGTETLVLGADGYATAGGVVDYSNYLLTGSDTATTSAIHGKGASATVTQTGGTLTVDDTVTVTTTAGAINLAGGALNGMVSGATINAASGALNAALTGSNTLTGTNYALQSVVNNGGTLTMSGSFNASALTLDTTAATHVDVAGNLGASGFAKDAIYSVTVANGTTVNSSASITHGVHNLVLGTDGVAKVGGTIDYSNYLLTGSDTASTAAIHGKGAGATVTQTGGTLTVDDAVTVTTTAGVIALNGGTLNGTVSGATINAASGALNAALTGSNTLAGTNYALQSVVNNGGTLTMSGSFNASALTLDTTAATHVDVAGNLGASGFAKDAIYSVTVANGTTVNSSASITHGTHNLVLGTDGVAKVGGDIDYSNYLLTGSDTASTAAIHAKGASATVTQQGGTLTVDDTVTVTTTAGGINLAGGTLNGSVQGATINAASGALNAALSGSNTLVGTNYALQSAVNNSGALTLKGSLDLSKLSMSTSGETHVDVEGREGSSGFTKASSYSITLVSGGAVSNDGVALSRGGLDWTLQSNGVATAGGGIDHAVYYLTGTDTASTKAIHAKGAGATVTQTGGTLTVDDTVTVTSTGGTISLVGGTLNGTVSGASINATSGVLNAALTGSNTLAGTNYALQSVVNNSGTLTMSGSFNAAALQLDTTAATHIDVNDQSGASGFAKDAIYAVTVANGTTVNSGATITHGTHNLVLGTDGVAKVGGDIDYTNYLLTGTDTAGTKAIHAKGAGSTVTQTGGTLTVDDTVTLATTAGTISLENGGIANGSIANADVTATGGRVNASISGSGSVTSNGDVTLSGVNSYTGMTTVNSGTLTSTALVSDITLNGGTLKVTAQTLGSGQDLVFNGGSFQGNLTTGNDSGITLVQAGTVAGGLTLNGGSLTFNGNKLSTTGALTLAGSTTLNVGNLAKGSYTLLSFGSLSGSTDQLTISGLSARYYLTSTASNLVLNVLGESQQEIIFPSDGGGATWEEGSYGFQDGDDVVFDNTGEVVINGEVKPGTITVTGDGEVIFTGDGSIGGDATLIKDGEGTLIMNDGNTYSGGTVINGGTVIAGGDTSFGTGDITLNDGVLDLDHHHVANDINAYGGELDDADNYEGDLAVYGDLTLGGETTANSITINSGSITGGSITDTDIIAHGGTINSTITGDTTLTSDGNVTINGDNSYTGGTTVNGGTLTAGSDTAFGTGDITLNDGVLDLDHHHVANDINAYGGELDDADNYEGDLAVYGDLTLGGETTANSITINSGSITGGSITDTDIIAHGGTINSTITGDTTLTSDGNVTINGDNSYTGGTTVNGGTLALGDDATLGAGDIRLNGGVLDSGDGLSLESGQDLVFNGGNVRGDIIIGTGSGIVMEQPGRINGTLTMDGGSITTNGNMLTVDVLDIVGGGTINPGTNVVGTITIIATNDVQGDIGALSVTGVDKETMLTVTPEGVILSVLTDNPDSVVFNGSMHTWQNGVGGYDDGDYVAFNNAGAVTVKGYVAPRSIEVTGNGATTWNGSGHVTGNAGLTKTGSGTLTINTSNSFTGGADIKQGTVSAGADNALGTGAVTMQKGTTLKLNGKNLGQNDVTVQGSATLAAGNGGQVKSLNVATQGGASGQQGELLFGEKLTLSGTLKTGSLTLTKGNIEGGSVSVTGGTTVKQGYIASNINGTTLEKTGKTRVEMKGADSFSGGATVSQGQLVLLEGGSLAGDVVVKNGAVLLTGKGVAVNGGITLESGADMHLRPGAVYELTRKLTANTGSEFHGNLSTKDGSTLTMGAAAQSGNAFAVHGSLTLGGGSLAYAGSITKGVEYTLATATDGISNTSGKTLYTLFNLSEAGYTITNTGSAITLTQKANVSKALQRMAIPSVPMGLPVEGEPAGEDGVIVVGTAPEVQYTEAPLTETAVNGVTDAMVQADWGVAQSARAFAGTLNGSHGNLRSLGNGRTAVWANAFGSTTRQSSNRGHAGADHQLTGASLGLETMVGNHGSAGIAIGHTWNRVNTFGMSRLRQDAQHAGAFGRARVASSGTNTVWIEGSAAYGKAETRGQLGYSRERWTQNSGTLNARVNDVLQLTESTALNFYGGLEYLATDSGRIEDLRTGSVQNLRGELGAGITHRIGSGVVFAEAALQGDMVRHNPQADVGIRQRGANPGRIGGSITVGGAYSLGEHWSVNAAYTFEGAKHNNSHNASVGATYRF